MNKGKATLSAQSLDLDMEAEIERISARLREILSKTLRKRGLVVAISGGIDSSVSAALCVRLVRQRPDRMKNATNWRMFI